jgi:hypothetical protein
VLIYLNDCNNSRFFTLLADETTDKSTKEKVSLCLRFVDRSTGQVEVREEFVGFLHAKSTSCGRQVHLVYCHRRLADRRKPVIFLPNSQMRMLCVSAEHILKSTVHLSTFLQEE